MIMKGGEYMASQKPFLNFVIDTELLNKIDDFQFENRFKSRAAAIKWLLKWALEQNPKVTSKNQ
jgi:metal-responsive CopG/Arc/MetJ family transcriptional regulator